MFIARESIKTITFWFIENVFTAKNYTIATINVILS